MADGEIRVRLDAETEQRLKALADAAGRSVGDYVHELITDRLDEGDWAEDERIADEAERTGALHSVEETVAHFRHELHKQVKKTR